MYDYLRALLFFFFPVLLWTACEKNLLTPRAEDRVLPPITMTGEGTFGCKINGEVFLHTPKPFDSHLIVFYDSSHERFYLGARESVDNSYNRTMNLYIHEIAAVGVYPFHNIIYSNYGDPCMPYRGLEKEHLVLEESNEMEILHFDTEERIISGTFQFTLVNEECQDTIRITEGRFDMPWLY